MFDIPLARVTKILLSLYIDKRNTMDIIILVK